VQKLSNWRLNDTRFLGKEFANDTRKGATMKNYQVALMSRRNGEHEILTVRGVRVTIGSLDAFCHILRGYDNIPKSKPRKIALVRLGYAVSELRTGYALGKGATLREAWDRASANLAHCTPERLTALIDNVLTETGKLN